MAASTSNSKGAELSKAEYLKRYLSADDNSSKSKGKMKKKRRKVPERGWVTEKPNRDSHVLDLH